MGPSTGAGVKGDLLLKCGETTFCVFARSASWEGRIADRMLVRREGMCSTPGKLHPENSFGGVPYRPRPK
jgi:hypothetical protein